MRAAILACAALLATGARAELPVWRAVPVRTYPHDPRAFTEGLFFRGESLWESTGYEGSSTIRQVRLADGAVLRQIAIPPSLFGEGIVDWGDRLVSITWKGGQGFRWTFPGLRPAGSFRYRGEGWGLTRSPSAILMSDGTATIRKLDPRTLAERGTIRVTAEGHPVDQLNELEWVRGELFANIWQTDRIARIDPANGHVTGWIDLSGLPRPTGSRDAVANGIAWDAARRRLFVTGKYWPQLYEVQLRRE